MSDISLLEIDRGAVVAPAGCGKTETIANSLRDHGANKPILVLTHTNSGVAALAARLDRLRVPRSKFRVATIDGWAMRLIGTFPMRARYEVSLLAAQRPNYNEVREAAAKLLAEKHVNDSLQASYSRILVDEYQDCSIRQHAIVCGLAEFIPTCVVGDPMQAIFGFGGDPLAKWKDDVCKKFPVMGELDRPWRWENAGEPELGEWLLGIRKLLLVREPLNLQNAPKAVTWVELDGKEDYPKQLKAARIKSPGGGDAVLIIGDSTKPTGQQKIASQTPGATTIEAVDLRDLTVFAQSLSLTAGNALRRIAEFAETLMTGVGANDLVARVEKLERGTARTAANAVERTALRFNERRDYSSASELLAEINRQPGTRVFRHAVLRACFRSLELCIGSQGMSFNDAVVRVREQGRLIGRRVIGRTVGSTLLLKGLESDVAVILNADNMDARNLYVAMTRGSKRLVICAKQASLTPEW